MKLPWYIRKPKTTFENGKVTLEFHISKVWASWIIFSHGFVLIFKNIKALWQSE